MPEDHPAPPSPSHFDWNQLKRRAKELLRAFRKGDPEARAKIERHFANPLPQDFRLAQAQLVVARSLGYSSWSRLKAGLAGSGAIPAPLRPRTRPPAMRTSSYRYGVDVLDGEQAWQIFEACRRGDLTEVTRLIKLDPGLVNAQNWYQFPIHLAVAQGHSQVVRLLLEAGAEPGQARYMYDSWQDLLGMAAERGFREIETLLEDALRKRYGYSPQFEPLVQAMRARDPKQVLALLEGTPGRARQSDCYGNGAVHWAVLTRQLDLIPPLLERGAAVDARRSDGQTPAQLAINGDYHYRSQRELAGLTVPSAREVVRSLIARGARYELSLACWLGDRKRVLEILSADPNLASTLDSGRRSPLKYASQSGHLEIVRILLERGADPNRSEELASHGHALYSACAHGFQEIVALLLEHGADPNAEVDSSGSCLDVASSQSIRDLLYRHGAYPKAWALSAQEMAAAIRERHPVVEDSDFVGEALARNDLSLVDLLRSTDPSFVDHIDGGSLRMGDPAVSVSDKAVLARLLELGFDPNRPDWLGKTALHHYAERGETGNLLLLLEHGADIDAIDDRYCGTPLAWAARTGQLEVARVLLENGADPDVPSDREWALPRSQALRHGHPAIVELLDRSRW